MMNSTLASLNKSNYRTEYAAVAEERKILNRSETFSQLSDLQSKCEEEKGSHVKKLHQINKQLAKVRTRINSQSQV